MLINNLQAIVLAAGKSKRFNTGRTKQLAMLCGRPMIVHVVTMLKTLGIDITLVVGNDASLIEEAIHNFCSAVSFAYQTEQHGTGHAVACSREFWKSDTLLILNGDMPLQSAELISTLYNQHVLKGAALSFMSSHMLDPRGYGRVISCQGDVRIVEEKECTQEEKSVNKINAGVYIVDRALLEEALDHLEPSMRTGEYYITDIVHYAAEKKQIISELVVPYDSVRNVNTLEELWQVEQIKRAELIGHWMLHGVRFAAPNTVHIDCDVTIETGSFIQAGVQLRGKTYIGKESTIDAFSIIENSVIGNYVKVHPHCVLSNVTLEDYVQVGPFAHLRENATLQQHSSIGNFVEVKNSVIGADSRAKHLSYIGDANIGKEVNIGAGTIVCNFNGVEKNKTIIKDNVFVGSNATLIAPLTIGKNSFIAAGSTITKSVEENDLAIARVRQEIKKGYASKLLKKVEAKKDENLKIDKKKQLKKSFIGAYKSYIPKELA